MKKSEIRKNAGKLYDWIFFPNGIGKCHYCNNFIVRRKIVPKHEIAKVTKDNKKICIYPNTTFSSFATLGENGELWILAASIDHANPISLGGKNKRKNVFPACIFCNQKKAQCSCGQTKKSNEDKCEQCQKLTKKVKPLTKYKWKDLPKDI